MNHINHNISVCIPAYNEEQCILDCLKSVSAQRHVNIDEILVGINSSTDRTKEIVDNYSLVDPRVRIVDSLKGKANAWNALNSSAKYNLRIFQDGDTTSSDDSYRILLKELGCYDIVGASILRNSRNKGIISKIINFPAKYIRPNPLLNGGLYLMNYPKMLAQMEKIINKRICQ
jgi:glycosyltransferase involved in cell wall biosynthesis